MALAHSRRPSMPACGDTAKAMSPIVRRESHRVIRSAAKITMSQARTSGNMSLAMQVRKLISLAMQKDVSSLLICRLLHDKLLLFETIQHIASLLK